MHRPARRPARADHRDAPGGRAPGGRGPARRARGDRRPGAAAGLGHAQDPAARQEEAQALIALLQALRDLVPAELQAQLTEVIRQVLLLLRALIDWWVARLDPEGRDEPLQPAPASSASRTSRSSSGRPSDCRATWPAAPKRDGSSTPGRRIAAHGSRAHDVDPHRLPGELRGHARARLHGSSA